LAATQWAADLAFDLSVPLVFAHVVEPVVVPAGWQAQAAEFEGDRVESGQRMLGRLSASVRHVHSECVVSVGRSADTIASLAAQHGVGLVVMGLANAEDSQLRRPGSIAYRVLRLGHVAVVVVPAEDLRPRTAGRPAGVSRQSV
jgi:nucleotide-binding universal stress UspA family protein